MAIQAPEREFAPNRPPDTGKPRVVQDPHRPGREYGRLANEERPVWAIVQHLVAEGDLDDPLQASDALISLAATDFEMTEEAVRVALDYYSANRCAIDTKIASNAAGTAATPN